MRPYSQRDAVPPPARASSFAQSPALTEEEAILRSGAADLGVDLSDAQLSLLLAYAAHLEAANKAFNLTGLKTRIAITRALILDSLTIKLALPDLFTGPSRSTIRVVDVGTGAGVPGIPLAICWP